MLMKKIFALSIFCLLASSAWAQSIPNVTLNTDRGRINLHQYKGKVVYLDVWASWCTPCRKAFPWMNDMQKRYQKLGFKVIAVNVDQETDKAKEFLQKYPAFFTVAYDPNGKVPKNFGLKVMPSSYIIDRNGKIIEEHKGFIPSKKQSREKAIRKALAN